MNFWISHSSANIPQYHIPTLISYIIDISSQTPSSSLSSQMIGFGIFSNILPANDSIYKYHLNIN